MSIIRQKNKDLFVLVITIDRLDKWKEGKKEGKKQRGLSPPKVE